MDDVGERGLAQSQLSEAEYYLAAARIIARELGIRLGEVHLMLLNDFGRLQWQCYRVVRSEIGAINVFSDGLALDLLPP